MNSPQIPASNCSDFNFPPNSIIFHLDKNREVLRITSDGRMIPGEGLSDDEVTQRVFESLRAGFPDLIDRMVKEKTASLQASLDTEKELREGAEKNYRDLCDLLEDNYPPPRSYSAHVWEKANYIRASIEIKAYP